MSDSEKTEVRKRIEKALQNAGLGKTFDREIPILAIAIYRSKLRDEREGRVA